MPVISISEILDYLENFNDDNYLLKIFNNDISKPSDHVATLILREENKILEWKRKVDTKNIYKGNPYAIYCSCCLGYHPVFYFSFKHGVNWDSFFLIKTNDLVFLKNKINQFSLGETGP
jgi:hypothetical protein